jgi:hypothetical protein
MIQASRLRPVMSNNGWPGVAVALWQNIHSLAMAL